MSNYKGLFTFDVDNHRYVSVEQADGIIDFMNYQPEIREEQKGYWYINEFGTPTEITHTRENIYDKQRKNFGNYFETKEEAEKAVEKLKAWKRLMDYWETYVLGWEIRDMPTGGNWQTVNVKFNVKARKEPMELLDLLFGGEK